MLQWYFWSHSLLNIFIFPLSFRKNKVVTKLIFSPRFEGKIQSFRILFVLNVIAKSLLRDAFFSDIFAICVPFHWQPIPINQLGSDITADKQILIFNLYLFKCFCTFPYGKRCKERGKQRENTNEEFCGLRSIPSYAEEVNSAFGLNVLRSTGSISRDCMTHFSSSWVLSRGLWASATQLCRQVVSDEVLASFPVLILLVTMVRWAELKYPVCGFTYRE